MIIIALSHGTATFGIHFDIGPPISGIPQRGTGRLLSRLTRAFPRAELKARFEKVDVGLGAGPSRIGWSR